MDSNLKSLLDRIAGGLFLMAVFSTMWAGIAEYNLYPKDGGIVGLFFIAIISVLVYYCFKFERIAKMLPADIVKVIPAREKKQRKAFLMIFIIEGLAIFITANVLINLRLSNYLIPAIALIVGVHFFPLGYIYKRSTDYFIATWICVFSITGMLLINNNIPVQIASVTVAVACAIATSLIGVRMIFQGLNGCKPLKL